MYLFLFFLISNLRDSSYEYIIFNMFRAFLISFISFLSILKIRGVPRWMDGLIFNFSITRITRMKFYTLNNNIWV